jgi:hypothetical protein
MIYFFNRLSALVAVIVSRGRIFIFLILWPVVVAAQADGPATAVQPDAPATSDEPSYFDWLDKPRDYLSERFVSMSAKMDSFFAAERVFEESRGSFLRVYGDLSYKEAQASDFSIKVQAKLVLPALQRRLKLTLESDDATLSDNSQGNVISTPKGVPNVDVPKDFRAGVQVLMKDTPRWYINTDAGIRIRRFLPDPFVRLRARRAQDIFDWQFSLTQSVYWTEQAGAGANITFDADHKLSNDFLGRSETAATWSDHDQNFNFDQSFIIFQAINQNNAMAYQAGIFGVSQPNSHVTDYALSAKWRHRLHREWLFVEVQPLLSWPEDQDFRPTTSILFRVEAVFGDVGCGCYGL